MTEEKTLPFQSFTFTLVADRKPRTAFRMTAQDGGLYELHVERGPASNPLSQFTRKVPLEAAERLRDVMQEAGVFGWEEAYGDETAPGTRRWTLNVVFREGVFVVASKGGSDAPQGFEALLEGLYRLDFPRPEVAKTQQPPASSPGIGLGTALNSLGSLGFGNFGGMSAGDLGAYGAVGKGGSGDFDFSKMGDMMGGDMQDMLADLQRDPEGMRQRMKDEFMHLSPSEQNQLIDALTSMGMGTRDFWIRFLRGE